MKLEDIQVGKKYWVHYGYEPTIGKIKAKTDIGLLIVQLGSSFPFPLTDLMEPREVYAPYIPTKHWYLPWTWFK
jgi:hypothetical protein